VSKLIDCVKRMNTDNIRMMRPTLHFPVGQVFEVPDSFNGPKRGTFYFRDPTTPGFPAYGPFKTAERARLYMEARHDDCA
jgi:hypothetical protein